MRKIIVKREGGSWVADDPTLPGSPPVGRGPTPAEALAGWLFVHGGEVGIQVAYEASPTGANDLVRGLRDTAEWIRARDGIATNWLYCIQAADALSEPPLIPGMLAWMRARGGPVLWSVMQEVFGDGEETFRAFDRLLRSGRIVAAFPEEKPGDSGRQFWEIANVE